MDSADSPTATHHDRAAPGVAPRVVVVGGGPAGLMAAEVLAAHGARVELFDAMPSCGRKFLLAGKGGLNLTHGEPFDAFASRYDRAQPVLEPLLRDFGPAQVRSWALGLGVGTFVGSSGRVFPNDLKAAPLLRAWIHRLRAAGVAFHMRHRWIGWAEASGPAAAAPLRFDTPHGQRSVAADAVVLALGGGSWARLGSDGAWMPLLAERGVPLEALRPSNCGFDVARPNADGVRSAGWSAWFAAKFAGQPLKNVALTLHDGGSIVFERRGEFVVTGGGVEGSLVYALSAPARELIAARGQATLALDLLPAHSTEHVAAEVLRPRGTRTLSTHLKSRLGLDGVKAGLLRELLGADVLADPQRLAASIKALPLTLVAPRPLDEAISSAGGVRLDALRPHLGLTALDGVFCAGEMLDWEAPTGGYLLTACLASGVAAAHGAWAHAAAAH